MSALDRALARTVDTFVEECSEAFAAAMRSAEPGSRFMRAQVVLGEAFVSTARETLRAHVERAFLSDAGPNLVARIALGKGIATRALVDAVVAETLAGLVAASDAVDRGTK